MRIAIIGTGGVGGYVGAKLWTGGNDVVFIARGEHLNEMRRKGLRLESPDGDLSVRSTFTDSLQNEAPFDLFVISVKSFDTRSAAALILPVLHSTSIVLSIQNGVENESLLADVVGKDRVLGGVAYIISTIDRPGVIRHQGSTGQFKYGEMDGHLSERCKNLSTVFCDAGILADAVEDIQRRLWEKWIFICGLAGMTAHTRKPIGDIINNAEMYEQLQTIFGEATAVARAKSKLAFAAFEEKVLAHVHRLPPETTSSMHYDLTHRKRIEVEALNGAAMRFGHELGVQTPSNERVYNDLKMFA